MGSPGSIDSHPIILFDGVCNLCSGSVQFIIKRDPEARFRFASLQSAFARNLLEANGLDPDQLYSIILVEDSAIYHRSTAALKIARRLSGAWPFFYIFIIIPPFIRDVFYNLVARYRYKLFGKKDECWLPDPGLQSRFIE